MSEPILLRPPHSARCSLKLLKCNFEGFRGAKSVLLRLSAINSWGASVTHLGSQVWHNFGQIPACDHLHGVAFQVLVGWVASFESHRGLFSGSLDGRDGHGPAPSTTHHDASERAGPGLDGSEGEEEGCLAHALCAEFLQVPFLSPHTPSTRGYPCEQIHKSIIGLLPRKHANSQQFQKVTCAFSLLRGLSGPHFGTHT